MKVLLTIFLMAAFAVADEAPPQLQGNGFVPLQGPNVTSVPGLPEENRQQVPNRIRERHIPHQLTDPYQQIYLPHENLPEIQQYTLVPLHSQHLPQPAQFINYVEYREQPLPDTGAEFVRPQAFPLVQPTGQYRVREYIKEEEPMRGDEPTSGRFTGTGQQKQGKEQFIPYPTLTGYQRIQQHVSTQPLYYYQQPLIRVIQ